MSFPLRAQTNTKTIRRHAWRSRPCRRRFSAMVLMALAAPSPMAWAEPAANQLPIPLANFVTYGNANLPTVNGNAMTIEQLTPKVILNWQEFNIGRDASVHFNQQKHTDWVALNRIHHRTDPSQIFGNLSADGQVYLINQNGIVFGAGAQIDVHSLLASTLNMSDEVFARGLADANSFNQPDLAGTRLGSFIRVEEGARIKAKDDGRVLMFAPSIENRGRIEVGADGQVILAAGDSIYLWVEADPNKKRDDMRGLLVEVGGNGGTATNVGEIIAKHGDITLMGFAVNQQGRISATTSVLANGTIRLLARDRAVTSGSAANPVVTATRAGTVTLGKNSLTEVTPDTADTATAIDKQKQLASRVEVMGKTIVLEGDGETGARIIAKGGDAGGQVALTAVTDPSATGEGTVTKTDAKIYLAAGSSIDVSGMRDVVLPMESNVVEVELRGEQLKDLPLLKDGFLKGKKVYVDVRKGSKIVDKSFYADSIQRSVGERSVKGGKIDIKSSGDVIVSKGATLNVAGGESRYRDGYIKNTTLIDSNGRAHDIADAPVDRVYVGFGNTFTRKHVKWGVTETWNTFGDGRGRFERGYVQGHDAGTVSVQAPGKIIEGELLGGVTVGLHQRPTPPQGGMLTVTDGAAAAHATFGRAGVEFGQGSALDNLINRPQGFNPIADSLPADLRLVLSPDIATDHGMHRIDVKSLGPIAVTSDLRLPAKGELTLSGIGAADTQLLGIGGIDITGDIFAAGGKVNLSGGVKLATDARIDVSGQWVNDRRDGVPGTDAVAIDGGTIALKGEIELPEGSALDVGGGAWLNASGKLLAGKGGKLKLDGPVLDIAGDISGYALSDGAGLELQADTVCITQGPACTQAALPVQAGGTGTTVLAPEFFTRGGFGSYTIKADVSGLNVARDTVVLPRQENFVLDTDFAMQPTGAEIRDFSRVQVLPDWQRKPTDLTLSLVAPPPPPSLRFADAGQLYIEEGATIRTDPGAKVNLNSVGHLWVDGTIDAPAGEITLALARNDKREDPGFIANQAIWLGASSRLSARGAVRERAPNDLGMRQDDVLAGGSVTVTADVGYVVAQQGSRIDVSAAPTTVLDLPDGSGGYVATPIRGSAGKVALSAHEGMFLDGDLLGRGADATGSAGSLEIGIQARVFTETDPPQWPKSPIGPREIHVGAGDAAPSLARGITRGDRLDTNNGKVYIDEATLENGGFDRVKLATQVTDGGAVVLHDGVDLEVRGALVLATPNIGVANNGTATLTSGYVRLQNSDAGQNPAPVRAGSGALNVNAKLIDVVGPVAVHGTDRVTLKSEHDIRLTGRFEGGGLNIKPSYTGSLSVNGQLDLIAQQIYPTTFSQFSLNASDRIVIARPAGTTGNGTPVLSAGGRLTLRAPEIVHEGVIKAPMGEIVFDAADRVTLAAGSVTSTSADNQVIPFGALQFGKDWVYGLQAVDGDITTALMLEQPPEKRIRLDSPNAIVADGATIDVRGGGDLFAYEFTPGPPGRGGDPLAGQTSFAIMPSLGSAFAPYDLQYFNTSNPAMVDATAPFNSVYFAGAPGIPAGIYPMLPARYALLPGAYLVTPLGATYNDLAPTRTLNLVDGSMALAGKFTTTGNADGSILQASRWSGYAVRPGSAIRREAEYKNYFANEFFTQQAAALGTALTRLPRDAGRLVLDASQSLTLDGQLLAGAGDGGRGAQVDITAQRIAVVGDTAQAPSGYLALDAERLSAFGAESLLLGGTRVSTAAGDEVTVRADNIIVATNGETLAGPELILAAKDRIDVQAGSTISGEGTAGKSSDLVIGFHMRDTNNDQNLDHADVNRGDVNGDRVINQLDNINADGALLRVAAGDQIAIKREQAEVTRTRGTLNIAQGATIAAQGSIALDATQDTQLQGELRMENGSLSLGAAQIRLGDVDAGATGLILSSAVLARFAGFDELYLRSYSSIDLHGSSTIDANNLVFDAASVIGHGVSADVARVNADGRLTLTNSSGATPAAAVTGPGSLAMNAATIVLGPGTQAISSFDNVTLNATREIVTQGVGKLETASALTLQAARITGAKGSDYAVAGSNRVTIAGATAPSDLSPSAWGARLNVTGTELIHNGRIDLVSGQLALNATTGNVVLGAGSEIRAGGDVKYLDGVPAYAPGGTVKLSATQGDINVAAGAVIDVAGTQTGGDAGSLSASAANGSALLDGILRAQAANGFESGRAHIDVANLASFDVLNQKLEQSGFDSVRSVRVRNGDIAIGSDVQAHTVEVTADRGGISLTGDIDASGVAGGKVKLAARDDIVLHADSSIVARATGANESGGNVEISTSGEGDASLGYIRILPGARIDVAGNGAGENGRVHLRAPRIGNDIKISGAATGVAPIAASVVENSARTTAEAFAVHTTAAAGQITAAVIGAAQDSALSFMGNTAAGTRLPGMQVVPGIEIRNSNGGLTLATDWDLSGTRYGERAGVLTLRAGDNLNIAQSLSDGFADLSGEGFQHLLPGDTWSYRLVAGADITSADIGATVAGTNSGSVTVAADARVRTGNGFIHIDAAQDLVLAEKTSAISRPGTIYTAGTPTALPTGAFAQAAREWLADIVTFAPLAYPDRGGDIAIKVGRDVNGAKSGQLHTSWLWRINFPDYGVPTAWTVAHESFDQNIGALGGGAVTISAGRDVNTLAVSIPTIGKQIGDTTHALEVLGGGDLSVIAGRDISAGYFYLGRGDGLVRAGGALTEGRTGTMLTAGHNQNANLTLAVGDGHFDVRAGGDITLQTIMDPMMTAPTSERVATDGAFNVYFFSYTPTAAVSLISLGGDIVIKSDDDPVQSSVPIGRFPRGTRPQLPIVYPGSFSATAAQGDITIANSFTLFPAPKGGLALLAGGNIDFNFSEGVTLSDADPALLPSAAVPAESGSTFAATPPHAMVPVHDVRNQRDGIADTAPVHIVAQDGTIANAKLTLAKHARIYAGQDIRDLVLRGQHVSGDDVTEIVAGRDVAVSVKRSQFGAISTSEALIEVAGPGRLEVRAGRHLDLGASRGIVTTGNNDNIALPDGGADAVVMAGVGNQAPDYLGFMAQYFGEDGGAYRAVIADYMRTRTRNNNLSEADAWTAFRALPLAQARPLVLRAFYNELRETGRAAATDAGAGYARGFDAIAALFPESMLDANARGDITLYFSKITTRDGGDIDMLAPRGMINAGLAKSPFATDTLGIVAEKDGDVNAMVHGDFLVNASRVFANQGGSILMWSSEGNIDAGRGAKTALNVVKQSYSVNADGTKVTDPPTVLAGSGIRAFAAPGVTPGNVDLIAPGGVVNAGDAGIGSQGNLSIAALQVVGTDNIQVAGTATGVPAADTAGLGAGLANVGDAAASATKGDDVMKGLGQANEREGFLGVEVLSFGELDNTQPLTPRDKRKKPE